MPIIVYITAVITQHIHGFHEGTMKWKRDEDAEAENQAQTLLDNNHREIKNERKNSIK